ncbi:MAG: glycosyltransferase family 4 protein [bacterium]|nr:glycosyltransferase family 4 protein [bacterium]
MRILIVTQAVDQDDPALGFFHRWLEEFAPRFESIEVICLKSGRSDLPKNVRVYSLGKERGKASRFVYTVRFLRFAWRLRCDYDAVFVHMNEEYLLIAGWLWRLLGKRIVLWRNHKVGSWRTRLAVVLSHTACYTSPGAFVAHYRKAVQMPIGIDTDFFIPPKSLPAPHTVLFLGRLDPVKKVEVFVDALRETRRPFLADIYGSPTKPDSLYSRNIAEQAQPFVEKGTVTLHPGVSHERTRELYRSHTIYVNLTPSGSFDKTIGEAMASGCIVVCANDAVRSVIRPELIARDGDARDVTRALETVLGLSEFERAAETRKLRAYIEENHSLKELTGKLANELINPSSGSTIRR